MAPFIHLIADYGAGDPAFSEVIHRLTAEDPSISVQPTAVPPLSTVATGFWIEQLGRHNPVFDGLMLYSNTAPRTDAATPAGAAPGGELTYLELGNGVPVLAVNAGYNLSFVKDAIRVRRSVETPSRGSQFRSRDFFPKVVAGIANGNREPVGPPDETPIPDRPAEVVTHVDGYGNVKSSIRASEIDLDRASVDVRIGADDVSAVVTDDVFAVAEGTLAVAPGSAGGADPYFELSRRGGSAAAAVGDPTPGDAFLIG